MREAFLDVCEKHCVHPLDLAGTSAALRYVYARRDFIVRCKNDLGYNLHFISKILKKDHTTIMHSYRRWQEGESIDPFISKSSDHHKYEEGPITKIQKKILELQDYGYTPKEMSEEIGLQMCAIKRNMMAANKKVMMEVTMQKIREYRQSNAKIRASIDRAIKEYEKKETPQAGERVAL